MQIPNFVQPSLSEMDCSNPTKIVDATGTKQHSVYLHTSRLLPTHARRVICVVLLLLIFKLEKLERFWKKVLRLDSETCSYMRPFDEEHFGEHFDG